MHSILLFALVFFPILSAGAVLVLGKTVRRYGHTAKALTLILVTAAELALSIYLFFAAEGTSFRAVLLRPYPISINFIDQSLFTLSFTFDSLPAVCTVLTAFLCFGTALLSPQYFRRHGLSDRYAASFLTALGALPAIFLSDHLLYTFMFLEVAAFASYILIIEEEDTAALKAGKRYYTLSLLGGAVMLPGLLILQKEAGTLSLSALRSLSGTLFSHTETLRPELTAAALCLLVGFAVKAGLFPFHGILAKANAVAPAPTSALLSGVLSQIGIFGILTVTVTVLPPIPQIGIALLVLGIVSMLLGALRAVRSADLKRLLSSASFSEIGFLLAAVAVSFLLGGNHPAALGAVVLYTVHHAAVKLVLFLSTGALNAVTGSLHLSELRGVGRKHPLLLLPVLLGGASLIGIPGTLGHLARSLLLDALNAYEAATGGALAVLLPYAVTATTALTTAFVLKFCAVLFVERAPIGTADEAPPRISPVSYAALGIGALPLLLGCVPRLAEALCVLSFPFMNETTVPSSQEVLSLDAIPELLLALLLGVLFHLFVVRTLLTSRDRSGRRIYVEKRALRGSEEDAVAFSVANLAVGLLTVLARLLTDGIELLAHFAFRLFRTLCRFLGDTADALLPLLKKAVRKLIRKAK